MVNWARRWKNGSLSTSFVKVWSSLYTSGSPWATSPFTPIRPYHPPTRVSNQSVDGARLNDRSGGTRKDSNLLVYTQIRSRKGAHYKRRVLKKTTKELDDAWKNENCIKYITYIRQIWCWMSWSKSNIDAVSNCTFACGQIHWASCKYLEATWLIPHSDSLHSQ